jgi:DNA (cytosine-5)-methyltransferase 1
MIHIDLFSGIGGFAEAANRIGWETVVFCEIDPFCRKILQHHFPKTYLHGDIKTLTYDTINRKLTEQKGSHWRNDDIIVTGGFP